MNGLLLIDKPAGMTSHDVVRRIRRICATRKVGHAGTLDPMATGVLVVAVGEGTKILQFLFSDDKRYQARIKLGETTDTLDAEGEVVQVAEVPALCLEELEIVCDRFRGSFRQLPPMYSALKRNGVPLYKLARRGEEVEREPRDVTITDLRILDFTPSELEIDVTCSKGTYVRTLAADIGDIIGCGGHLSALRRIRSGGFGVEQCHTLEQLQHLEDPATVLIPLMDCLPGRPAIAVDEDACNALAFGIPPRCDQCLMEGQLADGDQVWLHREGRLLALASYRPLRTREKRGDFELIRVFSADLCGE